MVPTREFEVSPSGNALARTPGSQVGLYKAHSGTKWWSSEKLEPRIPPCVKITICCLKVLEVRCQVLVLSWLGVGYYGFGVRG